MKWFRLWTDIVNDPKMRKITDSQFRTLIYLMCLASEEDSEGTINFSASDISWRIRRTETQVKSTLKSLSGLEILGPLDKSIVFLNWNKRQPISDNDAENKRKQREKTKNVLGQNKDTSLDSPPLEQNRTDTDTEQIQNRTDNKKLLSEAKNASLMLFEIFWRAYPKRIGKGAAERSWNKINPDDNLLQVMLGSIANAEESEQWQKENGQFIPNPATWLNQKRWQDEIKEVDPISKLNYTQRAIIESERRERENG
jgi:hypothetical protein